MLHKCIQICNEIILLQNRGYLFLIKYIKILIIMNVCEYRECKFIQNSKPYLFILKFKNFLLFFLSYKVFEISQQS